ncbi:hypothetical protein BDC45DRAFT_542042 [Circinella umbellata]|nr:hypothetical protein BDC45DRAFT_542042 [Circinella umbellata]
MIEPDNTVCDTGADNYRALTIMKDCSFHDPVEGTGNSAVLVSKKLYIKTVAQHELLKNDFDNIVKIIDRYILYSAYQPLYAHNQSNSLLISKYYVQTKKDNKKVSNTNGNNGKDNNKKTGSRYMARLSKRTRKAAKLHDPYYTIVEFTLKIVKTKIMKNAILIVEFTEYFDLLR